MSYPRVTQIMRRYFVCILLFVTASAHAQIGLEKYFTEALLPTIDNARYQDVKFEWTIPGKLQGSMNEGLTEMEAGNFNAAILDFTAVLEQAPKFWPAYYYRAASQKALFVFDSAILDFQSTIKMNSTLSEAYVSMGECQVQLEKSAEARESFEKAIALNPSSVLAHYNLGNIEFYGGNVRKALKEFEKCNELNGGYAPAYFMQSMLKIKESGKKNGESMSLLNKALSVDSTYREALFWRGILYAGQEKLDKCLNDWNNLVRYNPNTPFFLLIRGFLHLEMGDFDRAFNDLRKAILSRETNEDKFTGGQTMLDKQIDVHNATSYAMRYSYGLEEKSLEFFKKGFCYFLSGDRVKARYNLHQAALIQPSATVFYMQAVNYEHMSKHDSAFVFYDRALALDNDIFDAHKKRGIYRFEVKDWKGAYKDFNDMIRIQPDTYVTYRLRGFVKSHQKDYYGSIIDLTRYLKSDSSDAEVFRTRALCRFQVGDKRGAMEDLSKSLDLEWSGKLADEVVRGYAELGDTVKTLHAIKTYKRFNLTNHYDRVKQIELLIEFKYWDQALLEIAKAQVSAKTPVEQSEMLLLKGLYHFYQDHHQEAIACFDQALVVVKENLEARYFRGKCYMAMDQNEKAIEDFKVLKKANYSDSKEILQQLKNDS